MPLNKKGDHYANPAYGRMMEGGGSKGEKMMGAYGEKAAEYMKMGYMEPTVKVFTKLSDLTKFVDYAFNDMRHGYSGAYPHTKTSKAKKSTTSKLGGGRKQTNYPPSATPSNPHGTHGY